MRRHPTVAAQLDRVFEDLREDPYLPRLRLHPLVGKLTGYHAVSITYKLRIVLTLDEIEAVVTLIGIGTHDEVYR